MNRIEKSNDAPRALRGRRIGRSDGSAYLVTLMAIVVLTIIGLSLSLTTQTELQLGANEHTIQQAFYAADAGIAMGTAKALAVNDQSAFEVFAGKTENGDLNHANRVTVTAFQQLLPMPCNLCEINQGSQYFNVNHGVNVTANRIAWYGSDPPEDDARSFGRKTVGEMVEFQPWQVNLRGAQFREPTEEETVKF